MYYIGENQRYNVYLRKGKGMDELFFPTNLSEASFLALCV